MGWRDILRSADPSRELYLALRKNASASRMADIFQGGFEGAMEGLGNIGRVATIPARALAGAAAKSAGAPVNVGEYALTGKGPSWQYGDLLAGTLEDAGEIKPGGLGSKVLRLAGNAITDPTAAPALMSGAEAAGTLAGRMTPAAPPMRPTMPYRPKSSPKRVGTSGPPATSPPAPPAAPPGPPPRGSGYPSSTTARLAKTQPVQLPEGGPPYSGGVSLQEAEGSPPVEPPDVEGHWGIATDPRDFPEDLPKPLSEIEDAARTQRLADPLATMEFNPTATQAVPRFSSSGYPGWTKPLTEAEKAALAKARRLGNRG